MDVIGETLAKDAWERMTEEERHDISVLFREALEIAAKHLGPTVALLVSQQMASNGFPKGNKAATMNRMLVGLTDEQRLSVFDGYCHFCGGITPESGCTCMRDE